MGDSYASGVGAGIQPPDQMNRCFRMTHAHPVIMQDGPNGLDPAPSKFNHVACSGNTFDKIKDKELLDQPQEDGKYGTRPAWGEAPEFVTITMGGNDIGILNLVATCILSIKPIGMDCDKVIQSAFDEIKKPEFNAGLDDLMNAIVKKGRGTRVGDRFKVFVVGYAQFFNQETTQCDNVDFRPRWSLIKAEKLTTGRRKAMNELALALNEALEDLVNRFRDQGVFWIDYDKEFEGHRFCDREEPSPNDPDTWFFNYYTQDDPMMLKAQKIIEKTSFYQAATAGSQDENVKTDQDYIDALADAVKDDPDAQSRLSDTVRVMHPTSRGHEMIRDVIIRNLADHGIIVGAANSTASQNLAAPTCHGVGGDTWMLSRDQAISAIQQFCKQTTREKEYFQGSADSVMISATNDDAAKALSSITDCEGSFKTIIDGCDGNDLLNNPHNYKFGGTLTGSDGWGFKVQPTAKKPTEDICDVSYKFFLDAFEVRGRNFGDAKLGANGEGLKKEIDGCGKVTKWKFEWTPDNVKYQWFASGQLPIGTKSCMGRAVQSAGGTSAGNCHGSG